MNPFSGLSRDLTEIAAAIIGLATIGLLISNASGTSNVVSSVANGFSGVLATATFQGSGLRSNVGNFANGL
jgi:hypothetical protein